MPDRTLNSMPKRPTRSFEVLLFAAGILFVFVLPPFRAPDENWHFLRACMIAEGRLFPDAIPDGVVLVVPDDAYACAMQPYAHIGGKANAPSLIRSALTRRSPGPHERTKTTTPYFPTYMPLAYVPASLGIAVAKALGFSPIVWLYLARLVTFFCTYLLVCVAVRLTSFARGVIQAIALLPLTVQQLASISVDGIAIGACLLIFALCLRTVESFSPALRRENLLWALAAMLLAWTKIVYLPVLALMGAWVWRSPLENRRRRMGWTIGVLVVAAAAGLWGHRLVHSFHTDSRVIEGQTTSMSGQAQRMERNPAELVQISVSTIKQHGGEWSRELSRLGRLETVLPASMSYAMWLILLVSVILESRSPPPSARIAAGVAIIGSVSLIMLSLYLWWSPVGSPTVWGVQVRYFLPLVPILGVMLKTTRVRIETTESERRFWFVAIWAGLWWLTLVQMGRFFYDFPSKYLPTHSRAVVMAAVAVGIAYASYRRRERRRIAAGNVAPSHQAPTMLVIDGEPILSNR